MISQVGLLIARVLGRRRRTAPNVEVRIRSRESVRLGDAAAGHWIITPDAIITGALGPPEATEAAEFVAAHTQEEDHVPWHSVIAPRTPPPPGAVVTVRKEVLRKGWAALRSVARVWCLSEIDAKRPVPDADACRALHALGWQPLVPFDWSLWRRGLGMPLGSPLRIVVIDLAADRALEACNADMVATVRGLAEAGGDVRCLLRDGTLVTPGEVLARLWLPVLALPGGGGRDADPPGSRPSPSPRLEAGAMTAETPGVSEGSVTEPVPSAGAAGSSPVTSPTASPVASPAAGLKAEEPRPETEAQDVVDSAEPPPPEKDDGFSPW